MLRKFNDKKRTAKTEYDLNGLKFPVHIYYENRRNVRASIGKKSVNLRMPYRTSDAEKTKHFDWFENWLKKNEDYLKDHFKIKSYQTGDTLVVGDKSYLLDIQNSDNKTHSGKYINGTIHLYINQSQDGYHKAIKTLLSRIVGNDFLPEMERKVKEFNHLYFKVPVEGVKLKYTSSRWGSCSSKGNINFSTRLLFAPEEVVDYVIIHELAHRIEMNHSARFWKLVSDAMPDYKKHEIWLKKHGKECDF
jgi:predicted metal-dependent hydrolase